MRFLDTERNVLGITAGNAGRPFLGETVSVRVLYETKALLRGRVVGVETTYRIDARGNDHSRDLDIILELTP